MCPLKEQNMPNLVEITKLHPRAEWLLRGAGQHKLVDNALISTSTTRHNMAGASSPPRNNTGLFTLRLAPHLRVVPLTTTNSPSLQDDYCE
jgi:hypothetical protein